LSLLVEKTGSKKSHDELGAMHRQGEMTARETMQECAARKKRFGGKGEGEKN